MDKTNQPINYEDPVGSSVDLAIQKGYVSENFADKEITVEEAASILNKVDRAKSEINLSHYDWQIFDLKDADNTYRNCIINTYASGLIIAENGLIHPKHKLFLDDATKIINRLLGKSQRKTPPDIKAPYYEYQGMVELIRLDNSLIVDLKYATKDNFTGIAHYPYSLCLMNVNAAKKLIRADEYFSKKGMHIKIWDAYRPVSVQWSLYNSTPKNLKQYAPAPSKYSQHCKGIAADITLIDTNGNDVRMPTGFDDFSDMAHADYKNLSQEIKKNRDFLISEMKNVGFAVNNLEWWHFYIPNTTDMSISKVTFDDFVKSRNEFYLKTLQNMSAEDNKN
jgi:D-alanyl-D-alanine dipeptidase